MPSNIPNGAEIDVENMDFSTPMFVKDLDIAKNEDITILRDLEDVVCTLSEPSKTVELEEEQEETTEVAEDTTESEE